MDCSDTMAATSGKRDLQSTTYVKELHHSPEVVSAFLADLCNDRKWRQEVTRTELMSGSAGQAGAEYEESVTWEGRLAKASLRVAEWSPGSRLVVTACDPGYESSFDYRFESLGDGTELILVMSIDTKGPLRLIEPFMWAIVTRWVERDIDQLDSVLDRQDSPLAAAD